MIIFLSISYQCFFLGAIGVVFCASSLLSGMFIAFFLPATEVLGVFIYHESFKVEKGISLVLSLWGFVSYFYGEFRESKKRQIEKAASLQETREMDELTDTV